MVNLSDYKFRSAVLADPNAVRQHRALEGYLGELLVGHSGTADADRDASAPLGDVEALFEACLSEPGEPICGPGPWSAYGPPVRCLRFLVDGTAYALPVGEINRVIPHLRAIIRVPGLPAWCPGTVVVRGATVRVIDFQALTTGRQNFDYNYRYRARSHLLLLGRGDTAILADELSAVLEVGAQKVHWFTEDRADFWQVGLIKQSLTILLQLAGLQHTLSRRGEF